MRSTLVLISNALLAITAPAQSGDHIRPMVLAKPALAEIGPQAAGTRLLRLPSLEFPLTLAPRCTADARVESLVVSVADTQKRYIGADFADKEKLGGTLRLPERQIGPLAIGQFCAANSLDSDPRRSLRIRDAFTASVSLRCSSDVRQTMSFETLALEVRLLCNTAAGEQTDAAEELVDTGQDDDVDVR